MRFYTEVKDGEPINLLAVRNTSEKDQPVFHSEMTSIEIAELIKDTYIHAGIQNFKIAEMKPAVLAHKKGVRIDFTFKTKNGLDKQGLAMGAVFDDKLNLAIYSAAQEYYLPKDKDAVEQMLSAISLKEKS